MKNIVQLKYSRFKCLKTFPKRKFEKKLILFKKLSIVKELYSLSEIQNYTCTIVSEDQLDYYVSQSIDITKKKLRYYGI